MMSDGELSYPTSELALFSAAASGGRRWFLANLMACLLVLTALFPEGLQEGVRLSRIHAGS